MQSAYSSGGKVTIVDPSKHCLLASFKKLISYLRTEARLQLGPVHFLKLDVPPIFILFLNFFIFHLSFLNFLFFIFIREPRRLQLGPVHFLSWMRPQFLSLFLIFYLLFLNFLSVFFHPRTKVAAVRTGPLSKLNVPVPKSHGMRSLIISRSYVVQSLPKSLRFYLEVRMK